MIQFGSFEVEVNGVVYEADVTGEAVAEDRFEITEAVVTGVLGLLVEEGDEEHVAIEFAEGDDVAAHLETWSRATINDTFVDRMMGRAY